MRLALIADSHLSPRAPECVANWQAARSAVAHLSPVLTVHLGDISLDGQRHPDDLAFAARLVRDWSTEMRCLPGNHDMGDGSGEAPLDHALLASYRRLFGPDHWSLAADGWRLIGLNAQLLGSDTPQELEQWRWLETLAAAEDAPSRTALFLHRPVARVRATDPKRTGRYVGQSARERLLDGPLKPTLRLVASGHTHQHLDEIVDGVRHVWVPSSAFVIPDAMQPSVGEKMVGIGHLELLEDTIEFEVRSPEGMSRHELPALSAFPSLREAPNPAGGRPLESSAVYVSGIAWPGCSKRLTHVSDERLEDEESDGPDGGLQRRAHEGRCDEGLRRPAPEPRGKAGALRRQVAHRR